MKCDLKTKLRIEKSKSNSGEIFHWGRINHLKENHYYVIRDVALDGDAPKEFVKAYFYEKGGSVRKNAPKSWNQYIAKSAEKYYPHESIIEYIINRIGHTLGLKMNNVKLVIANRQIRFLSKYFLKKGEILVHGAEICGEYLEDNLLAREIANDKKTARELFSFEFITEAIRSVFKEESKSILKELVKLIVFDAIVGNNDRHFYNWAIIRSVKKKELQVELAPIYDSARGLAWNWSDQNLINNYNNHFLGGKKVTRYIQNACPRISIEENSEINHFDLVGHLYKSYPEYRETIENLITLKQQASVLRLYSENFRHYFINERNSLVNLILNARFSGLREITNHYA